MLQFYGFRGEAICSIQCLCMLDVVTRQRSSLLTFTKTMKQGKCLNFGTSAMSRGPCGTTITCHDLFYNMPVRRKGLKSSTCLAELRRKMECLALSCPHVSLSLVDEQSGVRIIQSLASSREKTWEEAMRKTFRNLFGHERLLAMRPISHREPALQIEGLLATDLSSTMAVQVRTRGCITNVNSLSASIGGQCSVHMCISCCKKMLRALPADTPTVRTIIDSCHPKPAISQLTEYQMGQATSPEWRRSMLPFASTLLCRSVIMT